MAREGTSAWAPVRDRVRAVCLRELPVFAELDDLGLSEVLCVCRWQTYPRGGLIADVRPGEDLVYVIVGGAIRVSQLSKTGRMLTHADLEAGKVFDLGPLVDAGNDEILASVTVNETTICALPWPNFLRTVIAAPASAAAVITQLRLERLYFEEFAGDAVLHDLPTRVRRMVRRLARQRDDHVISLTGEEIAWMAGTSKEQVSRVLADLQRRGSVARRGRGELHIPDPEELR